MSASSYLWGMRPRDRRGEQKPGCACRRGAPCACVPPRPVRPRGRPECGCLPGGGACACVVPRQGYTRSTTPDGVTMHSRPRARVGFEMPARKLPPVEVRPPPGPLLPSIAPGSAADSATVDQWPIDGSEMPRYARPRDLDFGNTGHGADVVNPGRAIESTRRVFFSKNRRFVYATTVQYSASDSTTLQRRRWEIPACWHRSRVESAPHGWDSDETDAFGDTFRTARLGDGIVHRVEADGTEVVLFPLGWDNRWGLARLDLSSPESAPVWTLHIARSGGLRVNAWRSVWSVGFTANDDFIVSAIAPAGADTGIAVYSNAYVFEGVIPIPRLEGDTGITSSLFPRELSFSPSVVSQALWVSVRHTRGVGSVEFDEPQPSAFGFDFSDPNEVRQRLASGLGIGLLKAVVARLLPSTHENFRHFTGIDAAVAYAPHDLLLAVASPAGLEAYDVTAIEDGSLPLVEVAAIGQLAPTTWPSLVRWIGEDQLVGTYALSDDSCSPGCGPPGAGWPVTLDYPSLSTDDIQQGGVLIAGSYFLWGWQGKPSTQGSVISLLTAAPDPSVIQRVGSPIPSPALRRIGYLAAYLEEGLQQETLWPMRYDRWANRVFTAARAQYGMLSWHLPSQNAAPDLATDDQTEDWYPTSPSCQTQCDTAHVGPTTAYPTYVDQVETLGNDTPGQLPANLNADHVEQAFPRFPGPPNLAGWGYGGEWMSGTVFRDHDGTETLLFADRGNNAVWAHSTDLLEGTFLDALQVTETTGEPVPGMGDVAALPTGHGGAVVGAVARSDKRVFFLSWNGASLSWQPIPALDLNGNPDGSGIKWLLWNSGSQAYDTLGNISWGLEGIFRIQEIELDGVHAGEPSRFGCALRWRQAADIAGDGGAWINGWDLALVPSSGEAVAPTDGAPPTDGVLLWRIPRDGAGVSAATIAWFNSLVPAGVDRSLRSPTSLQPRDLVRHGNHLYLLSQALRRGTDSLAAEEPKLWLLTLRMVPGGSDAPPPAAGVAGPANGPPVALGPRTMTAADANSVQQFVDATGPIPGNAPVDLYLVQALPLHSGAAPPRDEQRRLRISPDGRWLTVASGSTAAGLFVVDVGDPEDPVPVVVAGLSTAGGTWYGWDPEQRTLDRVLTEPAKPESRVDTYPVWPLNSGTSGPTVLPVFQAAPFVEDPSGEYFVVIDGSPITVWKIDPGLRADTKSHDLAVAPGPPEEWVEFNPLQFVGGLCGWYQERKRVALSGSDALFLLGDMGVVALPNDLAAPLGGCCVIQQDEIGTLPPGTILRGLW